MLHSSLPLNGKSACQVDARKGIGLERRQWRRVAGRSGKALQKNTANLVQTPAACRSCSLPRTVMPEQPHSRGSLFRVTPGRRTKTMPPLGPGRSCDRKGATAIPQVIACKGLAHGFNA